MAGITDKKILVVGASSGIGIGIAYNLHHGGATLYLQGRNEAKLKEVLSGIDNAERHQACIADLSNEESISNLVDALPVLDGLIYNAGVIKTLPARYISRAAIDEIFTVNVFGTMILLKLFLKQKKISDGASICFISSIAARYAHIGNSIYSASKGALNSFARSMALELAPRGIRVNTISPGMVRTPLVENMAGGLVNEEQLNLHLKNYPLGRFGQPKDIGSLAAFLMSDEAAWITGTDITIDGGYSIK
jgi:NAD(P)-dependent dehydrogenase (short-subunit alcohol dehydrogenase family)